MAMQQYVRLDTDTHAWKGAWPPPDRLTKAVLPGTDIVILFDPEAYQDDALTGSDFEVTNWDRVEGKTSKLEEGEAPSMFARGALYQLGGTDA